MHTHTWYEYVPTSSVATFTQWKTHSIEYKDIRVCSSMWTECYYDASKYLAGLLINNVYTSSVDIIIWVESNEGSKYKINA